MSAVLELRQVMCQRGRRRLFPAQDCSLAAGQLLRVEGANGAGKTTLLRAITGLSMPSEGEILWSGEPVARLKDQYSAKILYLGHAPALKDDLTASENLSYGSAIAGDGSPAAALTAALERAGLSQRRHLPVRFLSQGQRRRAALARLEISAHRPLWILDEPFNALDRVAIEWLTSLIDSHLNRGGMVAMTTHQAQALARWHQAVVITL